MSWFLVTDRFCSENLWHQRRELFCVVNWHDIWYMDLFYSYKGDFHVKTSHICIVISPVACRLKVVLNFTVIDVSVQSFKVSLTFCWLHCSLTNLLNILLTTLFSYYTCTASPFLFHSFVCLWWKKLWNSIETRIWYDEVFLGYRLGQMVERWENQRFEDHLCPCPQGTSLIMVGKNILSNLYLAHSIHMTDLWLVGTSGRVLLIVQNADHAPGWLHTTL
jgi:hypothetical protein